MIYTYQFEHIAPYISLRKNEEKLGQSLIFPKLNNFTGEYVILGISESYGVEANMGKTGAEHAWKAFLSYFLNIQHNKFIQPNDILIQGEIDLIELKKENDPHTIVETIDKLVSEEIHKIKLLNKTPIFIGGGHNNAYPIIKGVSLGLNKPISVLNIDAHADLRKTGERHSGNPFSYALKDNYLDKYYVHGLHEGYNNKYILNQLEENKQLQFNSYESILKNQESINASITAIKNHLTEEKIGLEIDLDAIANMPSSAQSPSGFSLDYIRTFIYQLKQHYTFEYVHLCEGAPKNEAEKLIVGKALSYLVQDIIKE